MLGGGCGVSPLRVSAITALTTAVVLQRSLPSAPLYSRPGLHTVPNFTSISRLGLPFPNRIMKSPTTRVTSLRGAMPKMLGLIPDLGAAGGAGSGAARSPREWEPEPGGGVGSACRPSVSGVCSSLRRFLDGPSRSLSLMLLSA